MDPLLSLEILVFSDTDDYANVPRGLVFLGGKCNKSLFLN
jgi:hypothetical protein